MGTKRDNSRHGMVDEMVGGQDTSNVKCLDFKFQIDTSSTLRCMPYDEWRTFSIRIVEARALYSAATRLNTMLGGKDCWIFRRNKVDYDIYYVKRVRVEEDEKGKYLSPLHEDPDWKEKQGHKVF